MSPINQKITIKFSTNSMHVEGGGLVGNDSTLTFYAEAFKIYEIRYYRNTHPTGGNCTVTIAGSEVSSDGGVAQVNGKQYEISYDTEQYIIASPKQKKGYVFVGWFSGENGQGIQYTDGNGRNINKFTDVADVELFAYYEPV